MLIDWFTVVAEIINFLLLVALMKHFLFGRLVKAIDEREQRIAGRLAEAAQKNQEVERQLEQVRQQALDQERQRNELIAAARREADEQCNVSLQKSRESVRKLEAKWREDLDRERQAFLGEVRARAEGEILDIVKRALGDLACSDLQHCAVQVFLEKLRSSDAEAIRGLAKGELSVSSAVELPEETRFQIRQALESRLGGPVELRFEQAPGMSWGLVLRGGGLRMGWSPGSYVEALEQNLRETVAH